MKVPDYTDIRAHDGGEARIWLDGEIEIRTDSPMVAGFKNAMRRLAKADAERPTEERTPQLRKIIDDLKMMRREEAKGVMVMANSDDTLFEDCLRRLKELASGGPHSP